MSIAAVKISPHALYDMIEIFEAQPWIKEQPEEISELWNICEKREEQELLKSLIKKFVYFGPELEKKACIKIAEKIHEWELQPDSTWIVAAANKQEIDGSTAGLQRLKNKIYPIEAWHARFIPNIPEATEKILNGQSVILFDDFIGSGKKMIKKSAWLKKLLLQKDIKDIKIYYLSFSGMQFGIDHLSQSTGSETYSYKPLKKAISEEYPAAEAMGLIQIMIGIENKLNDNYKNKKLKDFSLGFNSSEALYCAQNDNCPNNVFPVFWWPKLSNGSDLKTILNRAG